MEEGSEDVKFVDAESYMGGGKEKLTFRGILLLFLNKILSLSCVEWHGGYWEEKTKIIGGMGTTEKHYIPDSREIYCNAVNSLSDILLPHFDKEMKKSEEECEKELKEAYQNNIYEKDGKKGFDKQSYRNDKVEVKRKLFRALNLFLERVKYMEGKVFEDEA